MILQNYKSNISNQRHKKNSTSYPGTIREKVRGIQSNFKLEQLSSHVDFNRYTVSWVKNIFLDNSHGTNSYFSRSMPFRFSCVLSRVSLLALIARLSFVSFCAVFSWVPWCSSNSWVPWVTVNTHVA